MVIEGKEVDEAASLRWNAGAEGDDVGVSLSSRIPALHIGLPHHLVRQTMEAALDNHDPLTVGEAARSSSAPMTASVPELAKRTSMFGHIALMVFTTAVSSSVEKPEIVPLVWIDDGVVDPSVLVPQMMGPYPRRKSTNCAIAVGDSAAFHLVDPHGGVFPPVPVVLGDAWACACAFQHALGLWVVLLSWCLLVSDEQHPSLSYFVPSTLILRPASGEGLCSIGKFEGVFARVSGIDHLDEPLALLGATADDQLAIEGVQRDALRALEGFAAGPDEALAVRGDGAQRTLDATRMLRCGRERGIEPQVRGALKIGAPHPRLQRVDQAIVKAVGIRTLGVLVGKIIRGEDGACGERRNLHAVGLGVRIHSRVPGQYKPMPEAAGQDARLEHLPHDLHRIDRLLLRLGREPIHEVGVNHDTRLAEGTGAPGLLDSDALVHA